MESSPILRKSKPLKLNTIKNDSYFKADSILELTINLLQKPSRRVHESSVIFQYISNLKFIEYIKSNNENHLQLITGMANLLRYEFIEKNHIVFKYGDQRNKFYLILKGQVSVLIPSERFVMMNYQEYYNYLVKLKEYQEFELLIKTISNNKLITLKKEDLKFLLNQFDEKTNKDPIKSEPDVAVASTLNNYINRIKPTIKDNGIDKKQVSIYEYNQVVTLSDGEKFGDYAFGSLSKKRMGTVITLEDCDFAILNKENYDFLLNDAIQKMKNSNVKWILGEPIFDEMDRSAFERKYFNYFVKLRINQNEILVKEGEIMNDIYFIKSSSFIIENRLSLIGLRNLIEYYGGKEQYTKYLEDNPEYSVFMNKIRNQKIAITTSREVIGLDDTVMNEKSIFTLKCNWEGEYYKISKQLFNKIKENERTVKTNIHKYLISKKKFYLSRFEFIEKTLITKFENERKTENLIMIQNELMKDSVHSLKSKRNVKKISNFEKNKNWLINSFNGDIQTSTKDVLSYKKIKISFHSKKNSIVSRNRNESNNENSKRNDSVFYDNKLFKSTESNYKKKDINSFMSDLHFVKDFPKINHSNMINFVDPLARDKLNLNNKKDLSVDDKKKLKFKFANFSLQQFKFINKRIGFILGSKCRKKENEDK